MAISTGAAILGGAVAGGLLQGNAAKKAAGMQAEAAEAATAESARQYDISRADMAPYRDAGGDAVTKIRELLGLGPAGGAQYGELNKKFTVDDFENDPVTKLSMKYGLDLGKTSIDRGAGAAGLRNSGATLKALTRFGQDYAGSKAGESSARFYGDQDRVFNRLAGVSGVGQTATSNTAALGAQNAQNIGNIAMGSANARGAAAIAGGNAYSGALNTVGNYYVQNDMLDKIIASRGPRYTGYGAQGDYQYG